MKIRIALFAFILSVFFISKPASAGFESGLYGFFGGESEIILLATQSLSFLQENKELQKEIVAPLSVAIKDSLVQRGFIEVEIINHDLLNAPVVYTVEIFVSKDKEIGVFLKKNAKIKDQEVFKNIGDLKSLAEDIVRRLLDNSKEF